MANLYAVVSHPGPVESSILNDLAAQIPAFASKRRPVLNLCLRYLEAGDGPPLVLLHGRGSAATSWFPLLVPLAQRYRTFAIDLPGFGHASSPPFAGRGFEGALRFFAAPIEQLLLDLHLQDIVLAGHSLGGLVATELALRKRVRVRKLILVAPMGVGPDISYPARAYYRITPERLLKLVGKRRFAKLHTTPKTPLEHRQFDLYLELLNVPDGRIAPGAAFSELVPLVGPVPHRLDQLCQLEMATLMLWGDQDEVLPATMATAAAQVIPHAQLHIMPLGHAPHTEDPPSALPLILSFLGSGE